MPNDKCPCMSGKKYKFCCSNRKDFLDNIKRITGGNYIDTGYILSDIYGKSSILEKYLNDILPIINVRIIFSVNPNLNANMRSCGDDDGNIGIIVIKKAPIDSVDYFDLAHEFGHLLTKAKGYPATRTYSIDASIGTVLTNTIMDPMINRMLYNYGFDFVKYLKKGFLIQVPIFKKYPEESKLDLFQRHFIKCLIIEKELEWEIIDESILQNEFKSVYKDKYPVLYQEAIDFISYAKEKGMNTPETVKEELKKLRSDNKMDRYIEIC